MTTADELLASKFCEEIVLFLEESGVPEHSLDRLRKLNAVADHRSLLELAETYSNCMAFMNHAEMTVRLMHAWGAITSKLQLELKQIARKVVALEADKKADQDMLESYRARKVSLAKDTAAMSLVCTRLRLMHRIPIDYNDTGAPSSLSAPVRNTTSGPAEGIRTHSSDEVPQDDTAISKTI